LDDQKEMAFGRSRFCALLMILALSFAPWVHAAEPETQQHLYVLSKPIEQTTHLSRSWQLGHYVFEAAGCAFETACVWFTTHEPITTSLVFLKKAAFYAPWVTAQSWAHLNFMAKMQNAKELKPIAQLPDIDGFHTISGSHTNFNGIVA